MWCGRCSWSAYLTSCPSLSVLHIDAEYVTARFGNKDLGSYALFSLDDAPGDTVTISMFIRTRQSSGLLLVLANSTSQYLRLWLEDGRVKVQVNNFETLIGRGVVNDGHFHLVSVKLEVTEATLLQSAQSQGSMQIRPILAHPGDLVFTGGLPDSRASSSFGGYFKGCIQDLRINSKRLQFYPLATPVESYSLEKLINVTQGCSSDNACAVSYSHTATLVLSSAMSWWYVLRPIRNTCCFLLIRSTPVSTGECVTPCGMTSSVTAPPIPQGGAARRWNGVSWLPAQPLLCVSPCFKALSVSVLSWTSRIYAMIRAPCSAMLPFLETWKETHSKCTSLLYQPISGLGLDPLKGLFPSRCPFRAVTDTGAD